MAENSNIPADGKNGNAALRNKYISPFIDGFVQIVLKKWWWFLITGLLAGAGGIIYSIIEKPVYESRLTFALDAGSNDGSLSSAMNLAAQFGLGFGTGQSMFEGDNIIEILKSRRIIENVLLSADTFDGKPYTLAEYHIETSGIREILNKKEHLRNIHFPVGIQKAALTYWQDSVLNNLYLNFSKESISAMRPDKKLGIYEVKIKSGNEKFSKIFTDRLVIAASTFYTEITSKKDRETLEILEQRVASLKTNVGTSIDTRASTQDQNVNPAFAAAQSPLIKQQYNMQAYGEAYKEMFKTLEMARYQYLKKVPLLQIIDNADYPMRRIKPGKIKTAALFAAVACFMLLMLLWVRGLLSKKHILI